MTENELMLTAVLKCSRTELYANPPVLTAQESGRLSDMQARRRAGEPLQYILAETEFMGLSFTVDARTLIPRPETELMVDQVLNAIPLKRRGQLSILDLCTGSGNIAVSLAKEMPTSRVRAVDISTDALKVAQANARAHGVEERVAFEKGNLPNLLEDCWLRRELFDIIIANPPYIPTADLAALPADVRQEPRIALDGGADGLRHYPVIIEKSGALLKDGGLLALEFGDGQAVQIQEIFRFCPEYAVEIYQDYSGTDRFVIARKNRNI